MINKNRAALNKTVLRNHLAQCIRLGETVSTRSGKTIENYIDCRPLLLTSWAARSAAEAIHGMLSRADHIDSIYVPLGVPTMGYILSMTMALEIGGSVAYLRPGEKEHGLQGRLLLSEDELPRHGEEQHTWQMVPIDDVLTSGTTLLDAVRVARGEGMKVNSAAVLVDREEGGVEALRKEGVSVFALFSLQHLLDVRRSQDED